MKTENEIKHAIAQLNIALRDIEKNVPAGNCHWRITKAEIDTLLWVLDL